MLTSFPRDYPKPNSKKRSLVLDTEPQWSKRSKQQHAPALMPWAQSISSTPFQPIAQQEQKQQQQQQQRQRSLPIEKSTLATMDDPVEKESMDVMMLDDIGSSCFSERIDDMEKYLGDDIDNNRKDQPVSTTDNQPLDIYTLLERQHRPLTAMMVNGVLLPMERQQGGTKHCIPEFVLRTPNSTTCSKTNLATHFNPLLMEHAPQIQAFMIGNNDSMDID